MKTEQTKAVEIFVSYTRIDKSVLNELESYLSSLKQQNIITIWHDNKILPGKDWKAELETHLESASIILLLVSQDYLASQIRQWELALAMKRYEDEEAWVIPIIVDDYFRDGSQLSRLVSLPRNGPLQKQLDRRAAFEDIIAGIETVIEEVHKEQQYHAENIDKPVRDVSLPGKKAKHILPSFISDEELRQRCEDLLKAEKHYDRVIREACVILENRVRVTIGGDKGEVGVHLMARVFSQNNPLVRLSTQPSEQIGAMELYRGTMAFFRNNAGHHLVDTYSREDALRFTAWIDLLLNILATAPGNP
jgi:uncharacterized protein (TIGR02391 family)